MNLHVIKKISAQKYSFTYFILVPDTPKSEKRQNNNLSGKFAKVIIKKHIDDKRQIDSNARTMSTFCEN